MSTVNGPVWKVSRRLGFSVLESGKELQKRQYAPGQHGPTKRIKLTNYGQQLREKQKIRYMYGVNERQFYNTFQKATRMKGVTGDNFLCLLESRLDNVVYRMGIASTRRGARQLVNHGHILVNGKKTDIPSALVKVGSTIELKDKSKDLKVIRESLEGILNTPAYVDFDKDKKKGTYLRLPERSELNAEFDELLVVEYYNR